ncbi:MAG: hypothetical protein ACD_11C00004G0003 [uncultured bacterium]|nr:MAG: hypothetical protein ACD_11C00004G0003 [uncultured bacterium]
MKKFVKENWFELIVSIVVNRKVDNGSYYKRYK